VSHGKAASSSRSGQKDAWSKLLDGKKSGKERWASISYPRRLVDDVDFEPRAREKPDAELDTPLPKASYAVLKDRQIRDLLSENDLSTAGDRSQLIARHERSV
jgi:E3 ubiquitin-protein ligase RAD18